jgi:hypothetical protein
MQDRILIITLLLSLGIGISLACAGSGMLGGFFGVFLGIFIGYALIIPLSHVVCLLLPWFGIGTDPRREETETH